MGTALIKGFLDAGLIKAEDVLASDKDKEKLKSLEDEFEVKTTLDGREVIKNSDIVFLSVKPDVVGDVLEEIKDVVNGKLIVSVAAGISTQFIESKLKNAHIIRVMPNIASTVGEVAAAFCSGKNATEEDAKLVEELLNGVGTAYAVSEKTMDAVTGLSGSGPAYFYLVIKALADAGVEEGLSEDVAVKLVAQTAKGSAEMVLKSSKNINELIDMVCSPKGTTIEGLKVLKEAKVEDALKRAVKAATKRSRKLAK